MTTLYASSVAPPTTLAAPLAATGNPSVISITGLPTAYPYKMLIDWGSFVSGATQEAIYVTSAPTGTGPYTLPCTRGADGTGPSLGTGTSHLANAPVVHGVSAEEIPLNPNARQQGLTQNSAALTPWFAGLSNRLQARCNVVCIGDSITEGQHAVGPPSAGFENRWVARLRDLLRAQYPTQGMTGGGRGYINASGTGESSFTWPATLAGSPANVAQGPKGQGNQLTSGATTITYSTLTGDSADIMWVQVFGGGTFGWAVDGGAVTNVSTNGASTADGKLTRISLGTPGNHSLVLSWVSGGGADIDGIIEYWGDSAQGIQVHDAGHFGWQTSSWITALNSGAASGPAAAIAALAPSLIIISLGVNDQFSNVNPNTFQANLQSIITSLKAQLTAPYPSFVLNMYPPRTLQGTYTFLWAPYVTAAYNVAQADTSGPSGQSLVSVMDFTAGPRMPGADQDSWGFWQGGDLVHPSDLGHQMIADCLAQFLYQV